MSKGRILFWCLFLVAAGGAGVFYWQKTDPLHKNQMISEWYIDHNLRLLQHPHPDVASDAWLKLQHLYRSTWAAYFILQDHVFDSVPIHFQLLQDSKNVYEPGLKEAFQVSRGRWGGGANPIFYQSRPVPCKTVGQALLAIFYNEKKWKKDFTGNWDLWWHQNRGFYEK